MTTFSTFCAAAAALRLRATQVLHPHSLLLTVRPPSRAAHHQTAGKKRFIDDKIKYRVVQLVDPESKQLGPPQPLADILGTLDRKKHFVELVSEEPNPIVKIIDKKLAFDKRKLQKARARAVARKNIQKEVQLTWGVAAGDLGHKLKKVRDELERGSRVDLVFAPKKGQPLPSPLEMQSRAQETVDLLADVGREWKPREIKKTIVALFFQGTAQTGIP